MIIAVASGKGGTGKTTVSVNLARTAGNDVLLLDCDVEEPDIHLFLNGKSLGEKIVNIPIPQVDESLCNGCGECSRFCEYNAIVSFGKKAMIFPEMCHGCGGCEKVCPEKAIHEVDKRIGIIEEMRYENIKMVLGKIDVGVVMVPPLIRAVKDYIQGKTDSILDSPPGTSCPVITTIRGSDFVVLVTEPTPFGLNDLVLAVDTVRKLGISFGVVINRIGSGDDRVHTYCQDQHIPVLLEIPDDRRIAEAYSIGKCIVDALPQYRSHFQVLWEKIKQTTSSNQKEKP